MSERGRLDLSPTQLVAGGLATATATVASSYLGVAGTIIGAAFMSVATTAGAAVYQHYLDRGKRRYVTLVGTEIRPRVAGRTAEPAESAQAPGEPAAAGRPAEPTGAEATGAESGEAESGEAEATGAEATEAESTGSGEAKQTAELKAATPPTALGADDAGAERPRRPRWYVLAGAAFAIFAVVLGAITAVESLANKPVSAMFGKSDRSGTSLGETFGGGDGDGPAPARQPVVPPSTVPASPSGTATATPSSGSSEPETAPVPPPASPSAPATTRPPVPTPTATATMPDTQPTAP